eukprot:TRINITY_DN1720_c0_g1_i1.p1 TRINITY_DN1720_c0_g1~~TRINITY_DN1720_c0_g1_i1.p1  ORF type:complete len:276 (+),score=70.91 TRINITY_DN1720_c0_g1_i1:44-829(+)
MTFNDNLREEIEEVSLIYPEFQKDDDEMNMMFISNDFECIFQLSDKYPRKGTKLTNFRLTSKKNISSKQFSKYLKQRIDQIISYESGQPFLFSLVALINDEISAFDSFSSTNTTFSDFDENTSFIVEPNNPIYYTETIESKKSRFRGYITKIESPEDLRLAMDYLYTFKDIQQATHCINAVRYTHNGIFYEDFDDDGEAAAGSKLMFILQRIEMNGYLVVVARWFGGILLGPDRFKIISNLGRQTYEEFLENKLTQLKHRG